MSRQCDADSDKALVPRLRSMLARRPDWYRAILSGLAQRLEAAAVPVALGVGDRLPDFVLPEVVPPDAADRLVSSTDLRARGPLVVCFVRGGWCPFCTTTLSALDAVLPGIESRGATMVALTADAHGHGAEMQARLGLRFKVLSDVDCGVALRFGTAYRVPQDYRDALLHFGIDLHGRHGDGPGLLPMPAIFVCDTGGTIRFAHVSGSVSERLEPAILIAWLESLTSRSA